MITHRDYVRSPSKAEILAAFQQLCDLGALTMPLVDPPGPQHTKAQLIAMLRTLDPGDLVLERITLQRAIGNPAIARRLHNSVLVQLARKGGKL